MHELRHIVTSLGLHPRTLLSWGGQVDDVDIELALTPRPPSYDLAIRLVPSQPHTSLMLTRRELWWGDDDALTRTGDALFDDVVALRCDLPLITLFDHTHRRSICKWIRAHSLLIDAGCIILHLPASTPELPTLLSDLRALARRLAASDLERLVHEHLADPDPHVRDYFSGVARNDPTLTRLLLAAQADSELSSPDVSHDALMAYARDPELGLERRIAAFDQMLRRFPWAETLRRASRIKPFISALAAQDRGVPLTQLVTKTLPLWLTPETDRDEAFELLSLLWSLRPSSTPNTFGRPIAKIVAHLKHPQTLPWLSELAKTADAEQFDDVLAALDAFGIERRDLRKHLPPGTRNMLIARAPAYARAHQRGAGFVELAVTSLPANAAYQIMPLIEVLGELGDPASVPCLFGYLEYVHDNVRDAAIIALGLCARPSHITQLEPLTSGIFRNSRVKQLARDAIASIRARAGLVEAPGALSLIEGDPGGLSLPDE